MIQRLTPREREERRFEKRWARLPELKPVELEAEVGHGVEAVRQLTQSIARHAQRLRQLLGPGELEQEVDELLAEAFTKRLYLRYLDAVRGRISELTEGRVRPLDSE